jgi:hypothetical protein
VVVTVELWFRWVAVVVSVREMKISMCVLVF